jgi:hypothetical protein
MPSFTLTVYGTDFAGGAKIIFDGIEKSTIYIGHTELSCQIEPDDIPIPVTVPVQVRNPPPGGGDSNTLTFTILSQHTFSSPVNVSNTSPYSFFPDITSDGSGNLYLAWHDETTTNTEIMFSWYSVIDSTWSVPLNISMNSGISSNPAVVAYSSSSLNLTWNDNTSGNYEILLSQSTDSGFTWSSPANISNSLGISSIPTIDVDGIGYIYLAWQDYTTDNFEILIKYSPDNGATWSSPINISNDSGHSVNPVIVCDNSGNLYLAWDNRTPGNDEILFSRSIDNGSSWSLPMNISNNTGNSVSPAITMDSTGNLYLVWEDYTFGIPEILFSQSIDSGLTWSIPVNISNNSGNSNNPDITLDIAGNLNLTWYDSVFGNHEIVFSRSTDSGSTWSSPLNISNNSKWSEHPTITVDNSGKIHLAWYDFTPGNYEILYCHSVQ